MMFDLNSLE